MRILHFYKTYYPDSVGGVEKFINQLAISMLNIGFESKVLTLSNHPYPAVIELDGHKVYRVPTTFHLASTGFSLKAFQYFAKLAAQVDIIHYHYPWPFMDLVHFATRCKKPCILSYHADIVRQKNLLKIYKPLQHLFLSSVDHIVATSPNYLKTSKTLAKYRDKSSVIPIGLERSTYPKASITLKNHWRARVGIRFFLFIGVLRYYKGLHILIDALKGVDYPVVIAGDGALFAELQACALRAGLKNLHFTGALADADKFALLELCHAMVFPSHLRAEAFGISLLEGLMYGKPLISSEIGTGTSYINIDQQTGLVVKADDPVALRAAMKFIWDRTDIAQAMGVRAHARYLELFTATQMAKSYANLYESL